MLDNDVNANQRQSPMSRFGQDQKNSVQKHDSRSPTNCTSVQSSLQNRNQDPVSNQSYKSTKNQHLSSSSSKNKRSNSSQSHQHNKQDKQKMNLDIYFKVPGFKDKIRLCNKTDQICKIQQILSIPKTLDQMQTDQQQDNKTDSGKGEIKCTNCFQFRKNFSSSAFCQFCGNLICKQCKNSKEFRKMSQIVNQQEFKVASFGEQQQSNRNLFGQSCRQCYAKMVLRSHLLPLKAELTNLEDQIAQAEHEQAQLNLDLSYREKQMTNLNQKIDDESQKLSTANQSVSTADMKKQLENLEQTQQNQHSQIAIQTDQMNENEQELIELQDQLTLEGRNEFELIKDIQTIKSELFKAQRGTIGMNLRNTQISQNQQQQQQYLGLPNQNENRLTTPQWRETMQSSNGDHKEIQNKSLFDSYASGLSPRQSQVGRSSKAFNLPKSNFKQEQKVMVYQEQKTANLCNSQIFAKFKHEFKAKKF